MPFWHFVFWQAKKVLAANPAPLAKPRGGGKLKSMSVKTQKTAGFTIVELLIVIVIIAILAVVTIVAYNGLQARARASSASSALSQAKKKLELYKVDTTTYPTTGNLATAGVTDSTSTTYQYTSTTGTDYCLTATTGNVSYYLNTTTATTPTSGGCAGHGQGGVAAITNLALNPSAETDNGWVSNDGANYPRSWDSTRAKSGTRSISAANISDSTTLLSVHSLGAVSAYGFPVSGDTTYTNAVYFTADVPHRAQMSCEFRVGGSFGAQTYGAWFSGSVGAWTRAAQTCAAPTGADMQRVHVRVYSLTTQPAGTRAYADDFMAVIGTTTPTYADGNSTNWVWNGTANASTSTGPAS